MHHRNGSRLAIQSSTMFLPEWWYCGNLPVCFQKQRHRNTQQPAEVHTAVFQAEHGTGHTSITHPRRRLCGNCAGGESDVHEVETRAKVQHEGADNLRRSTNWDHIAAIQSQTLDPHRRIWSSTIVWKPDSTWTIPVLRRSSSMEYPSECWTMSSIMKSLIGFRNCGFLTRRNDSVAILKNTTCIVFCNYTFLKNAP